MTSKKEPTSTPADQPKAGGHAAAGKPFDPGELPDDAAPAGSGGDRGMPMPGVPMSDKDYELLKKRAKTVRTETSEHAQEDSADDQ